MGRKKASHGEKQEFLTLPHLSRGSPGAGLGTVPHALRRRPVAGLRGAVPSASLDKGVTD